MRCIKAIKEKIKHHFEEVIKTKRSPKSIALGLSLGSFIALLPIPFIDFFIGLLLITIFPKINKYALVLGLLIWNPVTKIPIYAFSYKLGDMIFGSSHLILYDMNMLTKIYTYSRRFLVGNLLLAILISLIIYIISYLLTVLLASKE